MNFILANWYLVAIALVSGSLLAWPILRGGAAAGLSTAAAVQLMNREKAVVVDVCSAEEFASGHIVGAKNIPLAELENRLASTVKNKNLPLVLVCQSGMRSQRAVLVAHKLGYAQVHSLGGGMAAWKEASLPVEKA